jgi:hypothetical protein
MPFASRGGARASSDDPRNRRIYPRRRNTYPAAYVDDGSAQKPAYGLDISGGGICLLTKEPIAPSVLRNLELLVMVGDRKVRFTGSGCWAVPMKVRGTTHYRYGVRLKQIADRDWDFVMEHSLDGEGGPQLTPGTLLTDAQRASILPLEKQHRIAEALGVKKKLDYRGDKQLPLVEYTFSDYVMQRGTPFYRLTVRSKTLNADRSTTEHRTPVLVAIEGDAVKVLD